jgi:hypothetical protein
MSLRIERRSFDGLVSVVGPFGVPLSRESIWHVVLDQSSPG